MYTTDSFDDNLGESKNVVLQQKFGQASNKAESQIRFLMSTRLCGELGKLGSRPKGVET